MNRRPFGRSEVAASVVLFDTRWMAGTATAEATLAPVLERALQAGIDGFDLPAGLDATPVEAVVRRLLRRTARSDVKLILTVDAIDRRADDRRARAGSGSSVLSADGMRHTLEAALDRLGIESVDLFFVTGSDPAIPEPDVLAGLGRLSEDGLARAVGRGGVDASGLEAYGATDPPDMLRASYNLLEREADMHLLPLAHKRGLGFVADAPMARRWLPPGRVVPNADPGGHTNAATSTSTSTDAVVMEPVSADSGVTALDVLLAPLKSLARQREREVYEILLAWTLQRPGVTHAMLAMQGPSDIDRAVRAAAMVLSEDEIGLIDSVASAWPGIDPAARAPGGPTNTTAPDTVAPELPPDGSPGG